MSVKKIIDTRLSYSSAKLLQSCSMKYQFYKVDCVEKDEDAARDETHFNVGKAFHEILENMNHVYDATKLEKQLQLGVIKYGVEEFQAQLNAMTLCYFKLHNRSGLTAVVNEIQLDNDIFIGFIDSVMLDSDGGFWVVDLKTTASIYEKTFVGLERDVQLNLYASFAQEIKENVPALKDAEFKGVRYRVTSKPKLKQKATEDYGSYVLRLCKSCRSLDVVIPVERLQPKETYEKHKIIHQMSLDLRDKKIKPICNYGNCMSYFRPCEYFSRCHGATATAISERLEVIE